MKGEWIGEKRDGNRRRRIAIHCADATTVELAPNSLDAVFTDPPYLGNVQYGELMDFCYVWLRRLVGNKSEGFWRPSTRTEEELTGNITKSRGLAHFTEGALPRLPAHDRSAETRSTACLHLSPQQARRLLCRRVAILDAGLTCSATFPCPAEMGGSIHIHGTASSIVDTVFVCRKTGQTPREWLFVSGDELAPIVASDLAQLTEAGRRPSAGDTRCIIFGHLTRMAIWNLKAEWDAAQPIDEKLQRFAKAVFGLADTEQLLDKLKTTPEACEPVGPLFCSVTTLQRTRDAVPF